MENITMKTTLLISAAAAALFAAAPAMAQSVGSVGVTYAQADTEIGGVEFEDDAWALDGAVAMPAFGDWTVTLDGDAVFTDSDGDDDTSVAGAAHLTRMAGADLRIGGFVGAADVADETAWTIGAEAQKYLANATLTGSLAYSTVDDLDLDVWSIGGDAGFFVQPNLRLNAGVSFSQIDAGADDAEAWTYGVGAEYQFAGTPFSVTGGYTRADIEGIDVDTFQVGVRYSFGGDLQARDRAGARLPGGVLGLLGSL
jgi:hypothetical protein